MATPTIVVWSMALGAIAAVVFARGLELLARPSVAQLRAVGYHASVFLLVLVLSGMLRQAAHPGALRLHVLQVLAGPVCVGLSNFWIHHWLGAARRDRLMARVLRTSAFLLPALAVATLCLPAGAQLRLAMALSLGGSALTCWLTLRAWRTGDRLALVMAAGCLLTLPALAGLYALAMRLAHWGAGMQALVALCAVLSNGVTALVLSQRERREWRTRETGSVPAVDPVTRVCSSAELVRLLVRSQQRRRHTRREGALVVVTVFDGARIAAQVGGSGLNEVWMTLAVRMQRQVGVVNPVGRYWDRCFVALVESIPARAALRTLGLRVAASVRQPMEVTGRDGEPVRVRVEAGIGVVHLPPGHPEVEDILDLAQRLAEAARTLPARAAMLDPLSGEMVAVEQARLGPQPRGPAAAGPPHRQARAPPGLARRPG